MPVAIAQDDLGRSFACEYSTAPPAIVVRGEPIEITEGVERVATHRAAEVVRYSFDAAPGKSYLIELSQQGLDFVVTVQQPDGSERTFDSPLRRDEEELILLEDLPGGSYQILIRSEEHTGASGTHRIQLSSISSAPTSMLNIWRLVTRGAELLRAEQELDGSAARQAYAAALQLADERAIVRWQAYAAYAVAVIDYWEVNDPQSAADLASRAASLYADLNESRLFANVLHLRAAALIEIAEEAADPTAVFDEALREFNRAAEIQSQFGMNYELAHTLNNVGLTHYYMGQWNRARESWQRAVSLFANSDEFSGELFPLGNLGLVDFEEGYLGAAVDAFREVLRLREDFRNLRHRVDVLSNLASVERILGNFDESLRAFSCAREMAEEIDYEWGYGWALAGIGETYYGMGEFDLAEDYLREALPIEQRAGDGRGETAVLRHLGNIEQLRGNFSAALDLHRQALEKTASPPDRALAQLDVANDLSNLGGHDEAVALVLDALEVAEGTASRLLIADVRYALGRAHLSAYAYGPAIGAFTSALDAYEALGMGVEQARTLSGLAGAARGLGHLERALAYAEASVDQVERIRGRVADPELRALYLAARSDNFELQIDILMRLQAAAAPGSVRYLLEALSASERSRARLTLDLLQRGALEVVATDSEIDRRRNELYQRLAERRFQRDSLAQSSTLGDDVEDVLEPILSELREIENELNLLESSARAPVSAGGATASPTFTGEDIQAALDPNSTLLQYYVGKSRSYAWAVTNDTIAYAALPSAGELDELARSVFDDLSSVQTSRPAANEMLARRERLAALIIDPVREHLTTSRLLIAADGALQYVPFGVLPTRNADGSRERLIDRFEVVDVPSISAVAVQRALKDDDVPTREVVAFVDPVFNATDPRLADRQANAASYGGLITDLLSRDSVPSKLRLDRLPLTAREADAITALVPEGQFLIARGFAASRDAVLATELSDFRIVHFATHAIINDRYADLSALILSQFDRAGQPRPGIFTLPDIYRLDLNADLVVLSACGTALGREIRSEGLLGLTQGFMHAGAKSLVASLWPVSDRATAELMTLFYRFMLDEGFRPGEALRRAQLQISGQARWRDPFYWAAFTLVGEWQ